MKEAFSWFFTNYCRENSAYYTKAKNCVTELKNLTTTAGNTMNVR